jgi:hypothetical protein
MTATIPNTAGTHTIRFTLDDEPQTTTERVLTPTQILLNAKPHAIDPATHYLIQLEGDKQISYQDKPDYPIHMHEHMKFISESTGPTPVS